MAFIAEYGVILREVPEPKTTPNGHKVVEVPVFFNDYERGLGNTTLETKATLWNDEAQWLYDEAQKHTKKDGTNTKGKGMPMFFIGTLRTNKYTNNNQQTVRENIVNVMHVSYSEVPVMNATGVIASEVNVRTANTKKGQTLVSEVPVFFNGFYPNQGKGAYETFVTLWEDRAQWLHDQAQKHKNKDGNPTNGKGMRMNFTIYLHTDKWQKDGVEQRAPKAVVADVKFPANVFGSNPNAQNNTVNTSSSNSNPAPAKEEQKPVAEATENNDFSFDLELDGAGSTDVLGEFDSFLKEINGESESA